MYFNVCSADKEALFKSFLINWLESKFNIVQVMLLATSKQLTLSNKLAHFVIELEQFIRQANKTNKQNIKLQSNPSKHSFDWK
jgi:hypothetical protein